jgi:3-hydroxyacyl-CoA dehydrogenase/3-hydroxy-2-methylbutyryl-CoA dehydrogenase
MRSVENKTFLVTGGASGLGEATVRRLVQEGANVIILDMNSTLGNKLYEELRNESGSRGIRAYFLECNVLKEEDVKRAIEFAVDKFGDIHGAINCAGVASAVRVISKKGPFPLKTFETVMNINVAGTFNVIRLVADRIAKQEPVNEDGERGIFVNVASIAAFEGQIGQAAYSASKGAIVSMTLPIARELSAYGIRVNTIAPGIFWTPMLANLSEKVRESLGKQIPFPQRLGKPEEFADLVVFLIKNSMMNGETVRLDGGIRMSAL